MSVCHTDYFYPFRGGNIADPSTDGVTPVHGHGVGGVMLYNTEGCYEIRTPSTSMGNYFDDDGIEGWSRGAQVADCALMLYLDLVDRA